LKPLTVLACEHPGRVAAVAPGPAALHPPLAGDAEAVPLARIVRRHRIEHLGEQLRREQLTAEEGAVKRRDVVSVGDK
jgi:hypothetical protein